MSRNLGCKKQKLTNASVRKGRSFFWFGLLHWKRRGCLVPGQLHSTLHFSNLTLFPSVWTTLSGRFLCHDKDATRRCRHTFSQSSSPQKNRNFSTHCIQSHRTGSNCLSIDHVLVYWGHLSWFWVTWCCQIGFLWRGNCDAPLSRVKSGVPCPFPWQPWFSHVLWTLVVSATWYLASDVPTGIRSRGSSSLTSLE